MEEGDDLSEFLSLLEEDCEAEDAKTSPQINTSQTVPAYRELTDPDSFLRPREDTGPSQIHAGDTDSSDDEDNRNFQEQNLTPFGRDVKKLMTAHSEASEGAKNQFSLSGLKGLGTKTEQNDPKVNLSRKQANPVNNSLRNAKTVSGLTGLPLKAEDRDCFLEPVSGIRVVNPLVTQEFISERTQGRQTVSCSMVKRKYESKALQEDWLTTGVIVGTTKRISQKSKEYLIWTISDLKQDMSTVTVFLFSSANTKFTQLPKGTVIGILCPTILPPNSAKYDLILSVNDAQRVLLIGSSKDYGICKSKTAKNEPCANFVNATICPYCSYHLSKEYKRHSGKPTAPNSALMSKVLGKSEVFYGGKSFSAKMLPPKKIAREHLSQLTLPQPTNKKIQARDQLRLQSLYGDQTPPPQKIVSVSPEIIMPKNPTRATRIMNNMKNATALAGRKTPQTPGSVSKLTGILGKKTPQSPAVATPSPSSAKKTADLSNFGVKRSTPTNALNSSKSQASQDTSLDKAKSTEKQSNLNSTLPPAKKIDLSGLGRPTLGKFNTLDLGVLGRKPLLNSQERAKLQAIELVRKKGPLKKEDPNKVKKAASLSKVASTLKRKNPSTGEQDKEAQERAEFEKKKARFLAMIETGSQHQDLIESAHEEAEQKYFQNMETKEKIEDKMLNTHKIEAKAVRCTQCDYLSLARSDFCRKQGHQVKIIQTHKRFFQCKGCKNHIWVLELVPTKACSNCGDNHWQKAGMIKDKNAKLETLRITAGDREGYNPANMNCLVPD
ncbi:Hypothetical predicted protein [Cloeon dipterum]|uniref:Protein MCM10 homolog n=1 Tax=Cloeon dipterum TaxID=197152 RepID=A0A8S1CHI8_9INSE|nr:Hypothetical predicted protein [Cloeon dipterum]